MIAPCKALWHTLLTYVYALAHTILPTGNASAAGLSAKQHLLALDVPLAVYLLVDGPARGVRGA
jgi:hypothetical protein